MSQLNEKDREVLAAAGFVTFLGMAIPGAGLLIAAAAIFIQKKWFPDDEDEIAAREERRAQRNHERDLDRAANGEIRRQDRAAKADARRKRAANLLDAVAAQQAEYRQERSKWLAGEGGPEDRPTPKVLDKNGDPQESTFWGRMKQRLRVGKARAHLFVADCKDGYKESLDEAAQQRADGATGGEVIAGAFAGLAKAVKGQFGRRGDEVEKPASEPAAAGPAPAATVEAEKPPATTEPVGGQQPAAGAPERGDQPNMADVAEAMARLEDAAPSCAADGSRMRTPSFEQTTSSADGRVRQATYACDGCGATSCGQVDITTGKATWLNDEPSAAQASGTPAGSEDTNGGNDMGDHDSRQAKNPPAPAGENNLDNLAAMAAMTSKTRAKVDEQANQLGALAATLKRQARALLETSGQVQATKQTRAAADELSKLAGLVSKAAATVSEANSSTGENLTVFVAGLKPGRDADDTLTRAGAGAKLIAKQNVG